MQFIGVLDVTKVIRPTVVIVDDEPVNIEILANILTPYCDVKVANSGERCLSLLQSIVEPDLILLDIVMPQMNGYQVLEELKLDTKTKDIPVIFVSSNDSQEDAAKGIKLGASDYITKPIYPDLVIARVNVHLRLKKQSDELKRMALYDQLTNLHNRYYLIDAGGQRLGSAYRTETDLSLLMIDIDHFKRINDLHGHDVGDQILQNVANIIASSFRSVDIVSRYGGEEFIIVLPECNLVQATEKAEGLRADIESNDVWPIPFTVSIGVACKTDKIENLHTLIKRADINLYKAKNGGRNCVVAEVSDLENE